MLLDWTLRLVLPVLALLLAAVIYEIVYGSRSPFSALDGMAVALLSLTMLGIIGWCIAAWLPSPDAAQQASQGRPGTRREERAAP
jgi:hypothetical protein